MEKFVGKIAQKVSDRIAKSFAAGLDGRTTRFIDDLIISAMLPDDSSYNYVKFLLSGFNGRQDIIIFTKARSVPGLRFRCV